MEVILPTFGGGYDSGGTRGGGDIRPQMPKYHCLVYCDPPNTGAMYGGRAVAGNMGGTESSY